MTVFWIIVGVALVGALFLAWRTDHRNRARRIALQGQTPGTIQDVRGDLNVAMRPPGGHLGPGGDYTPGF